MRLESLRRWAVVLDSLFRVPGTSVRFGLDSIVGLIPGLGDLASPVLARGLARREWDVTEVEAYRVVDGPGISEDIEAELANGEFDAVILTSGSVAERYAPHAAPADADTLVIAIGGTTAAAARAAGLTVDATSKVPSYDGILEALDEAWASTKEGA